MGTIVVECPACKAHIRAAIYLIGQVRPCPRCDGDVKVRPRAPEDSVEVLIVDDEHVAIAEPVAAEA